MAFLFSFAGFGQSNYLGTWNVINAEYFLTRKWALWGEIQTRSQKVYADFSYHELKGGFSYRPNKTMGLLFGIGQFATYSNGGDFKSPVITHELRMWEQMTLVNNIDRIKLEHRYRTEQRWRGDEFRNRFRYRINPIIPINKSNIEKGTIFATIFDEIFLSDIAPHFERNRFFAGLGYQPSKIMTIQFGWVRQYDFTISGGGINKDFLQTNILFKFNQQKSTNGQHPSAMD